MTLRAALVRSDAYAATDTITLQEGDRHRRRLKLTSDNGIAFLLDLPEARLLRDGDGLELEDGRIVKVVAAPEPLYEIRGRDGHHLLILSWHLGNRHLPSQIFSDHIRIRRDHVIREMLENLGASITEVDAGFDPEGGAYDASKAHRHHHDHA